MIVMKNKHMLLRLCMISGRWRRELCCKNDDKRGAGPRGEGQGTPANQLLQVRSSDYRVPPLLNSSLFYYVKSCFKRSELYN